MVTINENTQDEAECTAYLTQVATEHLARGQYALPIETFWQPGNLTTLRQAQAWWPNASITRGTMHAAPTLVEMLDAIAGPVQPHLSFMELLEQRGRMAVAWMNANNIDTQYPNETKDERKARKGREAVARHRVRAAVKDKPQSEPAILEAKRLHAAYIAACQVRKAAYDAHTPVVTAAKQAWEDAKLAIND